MLKPWNGVNLALWDTAGQEKFAQLSSFYTRDAKAVIIAYDMTGPGLDDTKAMAQRYIGDRTDCLKFVVACKFDKQEANPAERTISAQDGNAFATSIGATKFIETSAKTGYNVVNLFDAVAAALDPSASANVRRSSSASAPQTPSATSPTSTTSQRRQNTVTLDKSQSSNGQPPKSDCC